jgi:hypothetical protein
LNLIVIGDRQETRALARLLRQVDANTAAHFADFPTALAALREPGARFDFVLMETPGAADEERELTHAIRHRHQEVPIALISYAASGAVQPRLFGIFEKASTGARILNCVIAEPEGGRLEGNCARELGQIIYEYQSRPLKA